MAYHPYTNTATSACRFVHAAHNIAMQATYLDENDHNFTAYQRLTLEYRWMQAIESAVILYEAARKDYLDNRKNNACNLVSESLNC
jgi:hypothetical protein